MSEKVKVKSIKKPMKKKKSMNKLKGDDDKLVNIRKEIDELPNVSKRTFRKISSFEACIVMNAIFSIPGGSVLIMVGALYSNFIMFISGIFILLEGIFIYTLFSALPSITKNLKLGKIRRIIAKNKVL